MDVQDEATAILQRAWHQDELDTCVDCGRVLDTAFPGLPGLLCAECAGMVRKDRAHAVDALLHLGGYLVFLALLLLAMWWVATHVGPWG